METIKEMLTRHEGKRLKPYKCPSNKLTVGVGHNIDAKPLPPEMASYLRLHGEITDEMADALLEMDINAATLQAMGIYGQFSTFSDNRRTALVNFVFNVGAGTALKFRKMIAAIKEDDWEKAADEMVDSTWYNQVGDRSKELVQMIKEG